MAINTAVILGRLTAKPELRNTLNGKSVVSFTVAVNKPYNKDNEHPESNFIECVAWSHTAEFIAKYFDKGDAIAVSGRLDTYNYTDKNDVKRKTTQIIVENAEFASGKSGRKDKQNDTGIENNEDDDTDVIGNSEDDEDVPF